MRTPYEYQREIIEQATHRPYTMVQAACGTGKSLIAGQTAIAKGKPTLIITPKNIMNDFVEELKSDGVSPDDIFVYRASESHKDGYYEALEAWLLDGAQRKEQKDVTTDNDEAVVF